MTATLDDPAFVQHDDLAGLPDRGETVGNDEHRALRHQSGERRLDQVLGLRIHR